MAAFLIEDALDLISRKFRHSSYQMRIYFLAGCTHGSGFQDAARLSRAFHDDELKGTQIVWRRSVNHPTANGRGAIRWPYGGVLDQLRPTCRLLEHLVHDL